MSNFNYNKNNNIYLIFFLLLILAIIYLSWNNENFDNTVPIVVNPEDTISVSQPQVNPIIETPESSPLCKVAFDNYNLYPSSNPFVVKGNDINWNFKNNITDYDTLFNMGTKDFTVLNNIIPNYKPADTESTKKAFDIILQQAPLKIGCCYRNQGDTSKKSVLVRTPINPSDTKIDPKLKEFDFDFKSLDIPAGTCPVDMYGGSSNCDTFFDVYCTNVLNQFQKQNLKPEDFVKYAPECACYAPRTEQQQIYPTNTPPACYKTGCDNVYNATSYIDPVSRNVPCDITVCQNIFNAQVGNVGGNVIIDPKLENTCGPLLSEQKTTSDSGSSTNGGGGSSTTTGGGGSSTTTGGGSNTTGGSESSTTGGGGSTPTPPNNKTDSTSGQSSTSSTKTTNDSTGLVIIIVVIFILLSSSSSSAYLMLKK